MRTLKAAFIFGLVLAFATPVLAETEYEVINLGRLPGANYSNATAINNAGTVVGFSGSYINGMPVGDDWAWSGGTLTNLGVSSGDVAINSKGYIAVDTATGAEILNSSGGVVTTFSGGSSYNYAIGLNSSGTVVGTIYTPSWNQYAFVSSGGSLVDLNGLASTNPAGLYLQQANGINHSGQIVGYGQDNNGNTYGFLYSNGTVTELASTGGFYSQANAINRSGEIVGFDDYGANFAQAAAIWTSSGAETLLSAQTAAAGLSTSDAYAVNSEGVIVGWGYNSAGTDQDALIYSGGVMTDLNSLIDPSSGWYLNGATGINDNGQIVGDGMYDGVSESFLLVPIQTPEPISMIFFGTGIMGVYGYVARRRTQQKSR